jgi:voltage-gated sodium channel
MNTAQLQTTFLAIRNNRIFEWFVVAIIVVSALVIGAKTYDIPEATLTLIHWLDYFITIVFLTELLIRFVAEEQKSNFFKKGWNIFDTLIVTASLIPIDDSEMALIARLVRIFRVLRMVAIVPELRILLNALLKALPQLGYVAMLMFIIFYIYAAVGTTFFEPINPVLWGDIAVSMLTLFRVMTFEDWTDVMYETMAVYKLSWIYYLSFIFLTTFAFLNMIIGIVVSVLEDEHAQEKAERDNAEGKHSIEDLYEKLERLEHLLKQK